MGRYRNAWLDYIGAVLLALVGFGLLTRSDAVSRGISDGLRTCACTLVPALFPFMALSGFLSLSGAADILSIPLKPITTKLFKLPGELGAIVLLSLVGGYPVGAKSVALLLSQKKIPAETAERMLCFCVNCGPSFLISAVGVGMLFSKTAGVILFATQTLATLIIGAAVSFNAKIPEIKREKSSTGGVAAFVEAVSGASSAMITMCAFAILFSGVLALVESTGITSWLASVLPVKETLIKAVSSGFFEVTAGCLSASALGGRDAFTAISAIVSFGGLSVLFQIMSCFRGYQVRFKPLILARISHMVLSTAMALPLYGVFCETSAAFAPSPPPMHLDENTALIGMCLLCMCAILTLSNGNSRA